MKKFIKQYIKKLFVYYVSYFPIKFNDQWIYMNPKNIELVPPMLFGKYEFGMTKLIKNIVKKGWVVCEVGAYIGDHTSLFSNLIGSDGRVVSVEPQSSHFKLLLKNIILNNLNNVVPIKAAVSDTEGSSVVYIPLNDSIDGRIYKVKNEIRKKETTTTITIDNLLNPYDHVDLIKMDIQGWEEKAITGARKTILRNPKLVLIIEFWPEGLKEAGTKPLKLLNDIKKLGFNIYTIGEFDGKLKLENNFIQLIKDSDNGIGGFVDLMCSRQKIRPNFKN